MNIDTFVNRHRVEPEDCSAALREQTLRDQLQEAEKHLHDLSERSIRIRADMTGSVEPSVGTEASKPSNHLLALAGRINQALHAMSSNLAAIEREVASSNH